LTQTERKLAAVLAPAQGPSRDANQWEQEVAAVLSIPDPLERNDAVWAILRAKAAVIVASDRRLAEQRTAVKAIAKDLSLNLANHEAETILIEADAEVSCYEPVVDPGAEFITSAQQWLLHELILVGLNMLVGMPGAGKSRLLVALVRAFLHGQPSFLQRDLLDGSGRHVLIIGTDQDRQQWGELLAEQGLAVVVERVVIDGIEKVRYRNHAQITLHTSGGGFRLDADGMRYIRRWAQENPGGLIIIDSLSAVLPPGVSEGDETAGRLMRQIEVARQGLATVVTHHTSKQSTFAGELGVYSGSGHGSIDRAISRHIGIGYDTHLQAGKEVLHTESPRRFITSQKRGAMNQRIVVEMGPNGIWDYISTAAEDRELRRQVETGEDAIERLKGWKKAAYEALTHDWATTSQVFDALDPVFAKKTDPQRQLRRALRDLHDVEGLVEEDKQSIGEARWSPGPIKSLKLRPAVGLPVHARASPATGAPSCG
jgi:hypothetical protein